MSKKRKQAVNEVPVEEVKASEQEKQDPRFIPDEKLQSYYNEAYIGERERLNAMFGRLDTYPVVEERIVYRDPDLSEYVPKAQYDKKKKACVALGILFGLALAAAIALAIVHFVL